MSSTSRRIFSVLPPGVVPSDSQDTLIEVSKSENESQVNKEVTSSNKENVQEVITNNVSQKAGEAWTPNIEEKLDSLSLSNHAPPTYHIDLSSEVKGEKRSGTTKIKVRGPVWSPMKHRNKVAPKTAPKTRTKLVSTPKTNSTFNQDATPTGAPLSNSEGSLLNNDHTNKTTPIDQRPCSAPMKKKGEVPFKKRVGPATGVVITGEGEVEGLIEIHDVHDSFTVGAATPGPPVYSEIIKHKTRSKTTYQQPQSCSPYLSPAPKTIFGEEEEKRYIDDLVAMSPTTFGSSIKRTTSTSSSIVQALQAAADGSTNDSLYNSIHDDDEDGPAAVTGAGQYSEIADLDYRYFKELNKHDDYAGGVQLVSVRGNASMAQLPGGSITTLVSQEPPPDMQTIHYMAAIGDKKALEGILELLPIIQDPVELVLGSHKFRVREGVDVRDSYGRTPLMHAVYNGHIDCVKVLCEGGANVNIEASDGSSCLHHAAFSSSPQMLALLLSLGANGMKKDAEGRVPLHWAANNDDPQCINVLLDKVPGLGPNVCDGAKMTPLMWAAYYGQTHNIDALKRRGADSTLSDVDGMKAIHWSIKSKNTRTLQALLSTESSRYHDNKKRTVMHIAAEQGFAQAIEMIKSTRPMSVNDLDNNKRTPLHWATVCEKPEMIRALTMAGAEPALYDSKGMTALDYAMSRGLHYCALLIAQAIEEHYDREAAIGYHNVLSVGRTGSIGVRTLVQQEGKIDDTDISDITEEQILQIKSVCTGCWLNKFTSDGKGPTHCRFFWIDSTTMTIYWSKSIESRYIPHRDTKSDKLVGVRTSASSAILQRKDFDPLDKHKYAFTIFTNNKVLNMVAMSSEDYKVWLNGIQLLLHLGSEVADELKNGSRSTLTSS